jgi:N-acetylneuraminate synthase
MNCYIIAEIGVNHNGNIQLAKNLIVAAKSAGADAVKFQTFNANELVTEKATKADYQKKTTKAEESQLVMLRKLELSHQQHHELYKFCQQQGISFLSTPFDFSSVKFLTQELGLKKLKISSGDLTNGPMLLKCAQSNSEIILSTGMSTIDDIINALAVLAYGYLTKDFSKYPNKNNLINAYNSEQGKLALQEKVSILHCTSDYPAGFSDINLNVLDTYKAEFDLPIGYSDHSLGFSVAAAAVAKGACIIEKHITLDKSMEGPDHLASMEPSEFSVYVKKIREVEVILGSSLKQPSSQEKKNMAVARKSLVARTSIKKGEFFNEYNITVKRPGNGRSPFDFWEILNCKATRDYSVDELLD